MQASERFENVLPLHRVIEIIWISSGLLEGGDGRRREEWFDGFAETSPVFDLSGERTVGVLGSVAGCFSEGVRKFNGDWHGEGPLRLRSNRFATKCNLGFADGLGMSGADSGEMRLREGCSPVFCFPDFAFSMCRQPVGAGAGFDFERDAVGKNEGGLHGFEDFWDEFILLVFGEVEDEFVVDLEQHFRLVRLFP